MKNATAKLGLIFHLFEYPISRNFRGFDVRNAPTDDPFLVGHNLVVGDHLFEQQSVLPTVLIFEIHHIASN